MAIALVQSAVKDVNAVNNTTHAFSSALTAARLVLANVVTFQGTAGTTITTPTDTLTHTYLPAVAQQDNGPNTTHLRSWYVASSGAGSDTVTLDISGSGTGEITDVISEWSGIDTASPLSVPSVAAPVQSTTTPSTGDISPNENGCLLVAVLNAGGAPITITPAAGWQTVREYEGTNNSVTISVIYKVQTSAVPEAASWTISATSSCLCHIMAFRPAAEVAQTESTPFVPDPTYRDPELYHSLTAPWINSTANPFIRETTTALFDVEAGDLLVAFGLAQTSIVSAYTVSGGLLDWRQLEVQQEDPGAGSNQGVITLSSAVVDFRKRMSVTLTRAIFGGTARFGLLVMVFRNAEGVGHIAKSVGDNALPQLYFDVYQPHSDIIIAIVDNNAVSGATRTWRQTAGALTELAYFYAAGTMTVYSGYHTNIVRPDKHTVGLLTPGAQQYSMIAAEVKGQLISDPPCEISFQA